MWTPSLTQSEACWIVVLAMSHVQIPHISIMSKLATKSKSITYPQYVRKILYNHMPHLKPPASRFLTLFRNHAQAENHHLLTCTILSWNYTPLATPTNRPKPWAWLTPFRFGRRTRVRVYFKHLQVYCQPVKWSSPQTHILPPAMSWQLARSRADSELSSFLGQSQRAVSQRVVYVVHAWHGAAPRCFMCT